MSAERLAHDVGKYVARVARNVPEDGPFPAALAPLLAKDLYEAPGGGRPSARFRALRGDDASALLDAVAGHLRALDALEARVRAGEEAACLEACRRARAIDDALRAHAAP